MAANTGDQLFRIDVEIFGDEGSFEGQLVLFGSEGGARLRRCGADQAAFETIHEERFQADFGERPEFFAPYVESSAGPRAFIDAIIENRPAVPDLHDGVAAQRVIDAAIRSQTSGCRIEL
jgi:predicted dehydrogenase